MSDIETDSPKKKHENAASAALEKGDFASAFIHAVNAAECALEMAKQTDNAALSAALIQDAFTLMEFAKKLKKKLGLIPEEFDPVSTSDSAPDAGSIRKE